MNQNIILIFWFMFVISFNGYAQWENSGKNNKGVKTARDFLWLSWPTMNATIRANTNLTLESYNYQGRPFGALKFSDFTKIEITNDARIKFNNSLGLKLQLWGDNFAFSDVYGIGIQSRTMYFRSNNDFAWYRNGYHVDATSRPGPGGTVDMMLKEGKLGLGTPDPQVNLDGTGSLPVIGLRNSANWDHIYFQHNGVNAEMYAGGADQGLRINVGTGATGSYGGQPYKEAMRILPNGHVGIGTSNPNKGVLHVKGSFHVENNDAQVFHVSAGKQLVFVVADAYQTWLDANEDPNNITHQEHYSMWVSEGIVGENYVMVAVEDWMDYVFAEDYELMKLDDLKAYIKANRHLPAIPSEEEVKRRGYSLHEMNKGFLKSIEELTLYTIEQEEKIKTLEEKVVQYENLAAEVEALKTLIPPSKR